MTDWRPRRGAARDARRHRARGCASTRRRRVRARCSGDCTRAHAHRDRHRLRRPDRLRGRRPLRPSRLRRGRHRERHARALLRPRRVDRAARRSAARASSPPSSARSSSTSATPRRRARSSRARGPTSSWSSTPPRSPRTTGPRRDPQTDFGVNANGTLNLLEATRQHAPGRDVHLHARPTRSTATRRTACRWSSSASGSSCPRTTATTAASTRRCRSTRSMHSLFGVSKAAADLMVQEYGRYFDMPTVCFRGGCLTGPDARRRAAARLPLLPDALHGHAASRTRSSATTASRCATTSTPPTWCARSRPSTRAPRAGGGLQPRRRARVATARCCEAIDAVRADRGPRAQLDAVRRGADGRPPLVDLRPGGVQAPTTPGWELALRHRGRSCARSTTPTSSAGRRRRVKLSVVIPAHNEAAVDRADAARRSCDRSPRGDRLRDPRRRRRVDRRHGRRRRARRRGRPPRPLRPQRRAARVRLRGPRRARRVRPATRS